MFSAKVAKIYKPFIFLIEVKVLYFHEIHEIFAGKSLLNFVRDGQKLSIF